MKLSKNPMFHDKSKHIEIKCHYIRDMMLRGSVNLHYIAMHEHIANALTNPLARVKFEYFIEKLGVLQDQGSFQGKVMSPEDVDTHGLFRHGGRLVLPWSLM